MKDIKKATEQTEQAKNEKETEEKDYVSKDDFARGMSLIEETYQTKVISLEE